MFKHKKIALNLQFSTQNLNSAFTLVELIVVIVILAILATIAFLSFSSQSSSARDSTRMADTTNITKWLWVFKAISWTYPMPDSYITINAGTGFMIYQWQAWKNVLNILKMSEAKDNLDSSYYSYSTDDTRSFYSVWWFLENPPTSLKDIMNPFNLLSSESFNLSYAADYSKRYLFYKWDWVWILTESWTNAPAEQLYPANTTVNLSTESKSLNLNISSTNIISWTWLIAWAIQSTQNWNYNYNAPTACPTWFIPVPGNTDFNQPGFCVMKFEAKALNWAIDSWYNWHNYSVSDTLISSAQDPTIVNLTQVQAIAACKSIWEWYHLITENEWMAVARNIEEQATNWSTWLVWSWFIFMWHTDGSPAYTITWSTDDAQWYVNTWDSASNPWDSAFGSHFSSNVEQAYKWQKRTLTLSNWNVIWDLAWNSMEHVNKSNTLDWSNFNDWNYWISNSCWVAGFNSYNPWQTIGSASVWVCNYQNWYSYSKVGPKTPNLNEDNWIWRIGSNTNPNVIFIRGGLLDHGARAGIYAFFMGWNASSSHYALGFRCAK